MEHNMQVQLTYDPVRTLSKHKFKDGTTVEAMAAELKDAWEKVHTNVASEQSRLNKYAMAFAEVYAPEYDDALSGALTIALDTASGRSAKAAPAAPKAKQQAKPQAAKPKAKTKSTPAAKVAKAKGKMSKADQVRELIAANLSEGQESVVELAIAKLGMKKSQAKTYVRENWEKVASNGESN